MNQIEMTRGDTLPALRYAIEPASLNLVGASVRAGMKAANGASIKLNGTASIVTATGSPTLGYAWDRADTAVAGDYTFEFEVTFAGGRVQTFPVKSTKISVRESGVRQPPLFASAPQVQVSQTDITSIYTLTAPSFSGTTPIVLRRVITLNGVVTNELNSAFPYVVNKTNAEQNVSFYYTASNGENPNATSSVLSLVVEALPALLPVTLGTISDQVMNGDEILVLNLASGGSNRSFTLVTAPSWVTINPTSGQINIEPPNADVTVLITVGVSNAVSSVSQTFEIAVTRTTVDAPTLISHNGVTFAVTGVVSNGVYADGTPWVSGGSQGVVIASMTPETVIATRLNEDDLPTKNENILTGPTRVHGAMLNPGNAELYGSAGNKTTLAGKQRFNYGHSGDGSLQGYDSYTGEQSTFAGFSESLNIAGSPIELVEGTVVKAVSILTRVSALGRPVISTLVPLTVVPAAPVVGSFRPAPALASKATLWTVSDLRMDRLPNLSSTGLTNLRSYEAALDRSNFVSWQHTYNAACRNIVPLYAPTYGGDRDAHFADMLALCYDFWSAPQKLEVTKRLVQLGIDIAGRVLEGAIYTPNGGHDTGYKALVAFAAFMLNDDAALNNVLNMKVAEVSYNDKNPVGTSVWSDDQKVFLISQNLIDTSAGQYIPYTQGQLGLPEWAGDGLFAGRILIQNHLGQGVNPQSDPHNNTTYRNVSGVVMVAAALPLRLMGAMGTYNNQVFFDYVDRYMDYIDANGNYDAANELLPFVASAWAKDRGAVVQPAAWDVSVSPGTIIVAEKPDVSAPIASVNTNNLIVTG